MPNPQATTAFVANIQYGDCTSCTADDVEEALWAKDTQKALYIARSIGHPAQAEIAKIPQHPPRWKHGWPSYWDELKERETAIADLLAKFEAEREER